MIHVKVVKGNKECTQNADASEYLVKTWIFSGDVYALTIHTKDYP